MAFVLRDMTEKDIDQVEVIENEAFSIPWSIESFRDELKDKAMKVYQTLISEDAPQEVLGYSGYWNIVGEAHITNVAIKKKFRGKGFGRLLMEETIKSALALDLKKMTLEVRVTNQVAINLYTSLGFVCCGIRKGYYYDTGEDALIMWLYVDEGGKPA